MCCGENKKAEANFRLPPTLNITDGNVAENFKKWKREIQIYLVASGAADKPDETTTAIVLHCAGPKVIDIYDQFTWSSPDDKNKPNHVLAKLEEYCNPRQSEVLKTYRFWNHKWDTDEPFDSFLTDLRIKGESCNYEEKERMIRDKIVLTVSGKLQELLLKCY